MKDIEIIDAILAYPEVQKKIGVSSDQIFFSWTIIITEKFRAFLNSLGRNWYYLPSDGFVYISRKEA